MPVANRYYERVRGWATSVLPGIALDNWFDPITKNVRQVDWHGGFTAGAGHAIYTARAYPREYWNRTAFVTEPTGHLIATSRSSPPEPASARGIPGISWPVMTSGPLPSRRKSDRTATSGSSTGTTSSCSTTRRRSASRPDGATRMKRTSATRRTAASTGSHTP